MLDAQGCQALLRASYTDESATYVVTVGVAVLGTAARATAAAAALNKATAAPQPGVDAASFAGTTAGSFGNGQRQLTKSEAAGPYVIMYAAGYADGRPRVPIGNDTYAQGEMAAAAQGVQQSRGQHAGRATPGPPLPRDIRMLSPRAPSVAGAELSPR